jgi:hypothetical protein
MAEIVLSNPEIAVLGGPASVNVELDFGSSGERGSRIFAGIGKPATAGLSPNLFDMYINYDADDDEFSFMYQYLNQDGVEQWVSVIKLIPEAYSSRPSPTFVSGEVTLNIPVHQIIPATLSGGAATPDNFAVQISFSGTNPVAYSIEYPTDLTSSGSNIFFSPTIHASELSSGTWSPVVGEKEFSVSVTVV